MIDFLADGALGPELSSATRRVVTESEPRGRIEETLDGWPYLVVGEGVDAPLDGPLGYEALEHLADERDSSIVVFGLGLGHAIRAIRGAGGRIAFVFEPEPGIVRKYLEAGPMDLGGIRIITDLSDLLNEWGRLVGSDGRVHLIDTPGYPQVFPGARRSLVDSITRMLERSVVNEATFRTRGRAWISDIIANAEFMKQAPNALHLHGAYRGVPAFIVGAGPSLSKNVGLLGEASKKGLVFATNSSARALDRAGVVPQVLGCIESIDLSRFLEGLSFLDRVARVLSFTSHPKHFQVSDGPILTIHELLPQVSAPFERLYGKAALPVSGSVSTALVALALRLGCSPIVLVGQDLAFTGGEAYSKDTVFEGSRITVAADGKTIAYERCEAKASTGIAGPTTVLNERVEWVSSWGGGPSVPSTMAFGHVRTWLERFASVLARAETPPTLVNATEGGARVAGFDERTLADVLAELPEHPVTPESILDLARAKGGCLSGHEVHDFFRAQAEGARLVERAGSSLEEVSTTVSASWHARGPEETVERMRALDAAEKALKERLAEFPWTDVWAWADVDRLGSGRRGGNDVLAGIEYEGKLGGIIARAASDLANRLEECAKSLAV